MTTHPFPFHARGRTLCFVDEQYPADDLPHLYRAVLDTVGRLEHLGEREAAWKIRRDALNTYSTHWDEHGRRSLERLNVEAQRRLATSPRADRSSFAASTEPV